MCNAHALELPDYHQELRNIIWGSRLNKKGFGFTLSISLFILAFATWYAWMSFATYRTNWIEAKVQ